MRTSRLTTIIVTCTMLLLIGGCTGSSAPEQRAVATEVARQVQATSTALAAQSKPGGPSAGSSATPQAKAAVPTRPEAAPAAQKPASGQSTSAGSSSTPSNLQCASNAVLSAPFRNDPEGTAAAALAKNLNVPYRNIRAQSLSNDGAFAKIRLCVEARPSSNQDWTDFNGEYELANVGGTWRVQKSGDVQAVREIMSRQLAVAGATATISAIATATAETFQAATNDAKNIEIRLLSVREGTRREGFSYSSTNWVMFEVRSLDGKPRKVALQRVA